MVGISINFIYRWQIWDLEELSHLPENSEMSQNLNSWQSGIRFHTHWYCTIFPHWFVIMALSPGVIHFSLKELSWLVYPNSSAGWPVANSRKCPSPWSRRAWRPLVLLVPSGPALCPPLKLLWDAHVSHHHQFSTKMLMPPCLNAPQFPLWNVK